MFLMTRGPYWWQFAAKTTELSQENFTMITENQKSRFLTRLPIIKVNNSLKYNFQESGLPGAGKIEANYLAPHKDVLMRYMLTSV